jgi:iron(III) transport system substrate-binding protein
MMNVNTYARLVTSLLCALIVFGLTAAAVAVSDDEYDQWLQRAELGPYQPEVEDWDAIYQAALEEPPLQVYAGTSRIFPAIEDLEQEYPGLRIEALNIESQDILERVRREWDAGLRNVGLVFSAIPAIHHDLLLPRRAVTRYVPRELEGLMAEEELEPLLRQRYSAYVWFYNSDEFDAPPWENIWQLTTEEFRNRVVIGDMLEGISTLTFFTAINVHADEMAELYEDYFGEPIELETPNAGMEFIKRLLENDARIVRASREVVETIDQSTGPFAGLTGYSRYRDALDGDYALAVDTESPAASDFWYLSIGTLTESPNTAKILIRWLMTEEGGKQWAGPNFPANPNVTIQPPFELTLRDFAIMWSPTPEESSEFHDMLIDYWMLWR